MADSLDLRAIMSHLPNHAVHATEEMTNWLWLFHFHFFPGDLASLREAIVGPTSLKSSTCTLRINLARLWENRHSHRGGSQSRISAISHEVISSVFSIHWVAVQAHTELNAWSFHVSFGPFMCPLAVRQPCTSDNVGGFHAGAQF